MGTRKLMTTGWMREEMMKVIELYYFNQNVIVSLFIRLKKKKVQKCMLGGEVSGFEI